MIKSIKFTGEQGYITSKVPEPGCAVRSYGERYRRKPYTEEEKELIKEYRKEMRWWKKHKDDYSKPHLVKNLLNREFNFTDGINIIFGPNASGKTTILKALGGNAGTEDGFARLMEPCRISHDWGRKINSADVRNTLIGMMSNTAQVNWDGTPVYYHNFEGKKHHALGDLCGSVLGDSIRDEILYSMNKNHLSMGQNSIFLWNKLCEIGKKPTCYGQIFSKYIKDGKIDSELLRKSMNDTWAVAYEEQLKYFLSFEKSFIDAPITFLFDEIDKSMDILNVFTLYGGILPKLVETVGVQIILVSHSPLVLLDKIRENVNFISIDEQYTDECLKLVNQFK